MNRIFVITYSDDKYTELQRSLLSHTKDMGMYSFPMFSRRELEKYSAYQKFMNDNKNILDQQRGNGYWLWKPYIIDRMLHLIKEDDVILYMDCGDWVDQNPKDFLLQRMKDCDILLTKGGHPQKNYTKRDCFVLMDCDTEQYHNVIQVEAGIIALKKTDFTIKLVKEWLQWCTDERILTDIPNTCGKDNFATFIDHRHDQSVLTNLMVKYNIPCTDEMRKFITCNVNKP